MLEELHTQMKSVDEDCTHSGRYYNVSDILTITVLGLFCGLKQIDEIHDWCCVPQNKDFFQKKFGINKIPSRSHFYNLLSYVNHDAFNRAFGRWIQKVIFKNDKNVTIAFDGKSIRSTTHLSNDNTTLHITSAMIADTGIIIGSKASQSKKESEVQVLREMLSELDLENAMVVADALHCKKKTAQAIIEAKADYLLVVKDNNKNFKESIKVACANKSSSNHTAHAEKNGGRIENRKAFVCTDIAHLYDIEKWQNIACVGAIYRETEKNGVKTSEWSYYISSRVLTAEELLHHARLEWQVEAMHWLLDVHFQEDKTKVRDMELQKNLNLIRKIALNFVKQYQASLSKHLAVSKILRKNLFDINHLIGFIAHFEQYRELD